MSIDLALDLRNAANGERKRRIGRRRADGQDRHVGASDARRACVPELLFGESRVRFGRRAAAGTAETIDHDDVAIAIPAGCVCEPHGQAETDDARRGARENRSSSDRKIHATRS